MIMPAKKYLYVFVILCLTAVAFQSKVLFDKELKVDLTGKLLDFSFKYKENSSLMPVSVTRIKNNFYAVANYTDVFLLNIENGEFFKCEVEWFIGKTHASVTKKKLFMPTGLFYSEPNKKLYVANYKGNNILVFNVSVEEKKLFYVTEIKSNHTVGPENIYVSNDGLLLASANYDGGNVTLFKLSENNYQELWHEKIEQAHGVSILGDYVYVTGLTRRKLYKLSLSGGKITKALGERDSNPENDGFLWPTSVYPLDKDRLVVSDAHTGYIYIVDAATLTITSYFGGNGPTYKYLHMPYSIFTDGQVFMIASTFQNRVLYGKVSSWDVQKSFVFKDRHWEEVRGKKVRSLIKQYDKYKYKRGPRVTLFGHDFYPGFGHLFPASRKYPRLRLPEAPSLTNDSGYLYFTDIVFVDENKWVLFSPESESALLFYSYLGVLYLIPFELDGSDYWKIKNELVGPAGKYSLLEITKKMHVSVADLSNARMKGGLLRTEDLWREFYANHTAPFLAYALEEFKVRFDSLFKLGAGKIFLAGYNKLLGQESVESEDVRRLAVEYYENVSSNKIIDLTEFVTVQMLTGHYAKDSDGQFNFFN